MRWLVALALVAGCDKLFGVSDPLPSDAGRSGDGANGDGSTCIGAGLITYCPSALPGPLTLDGTYDTSIEPCLGDPSGPCILVGSTITVPAGGVVATGSRPLALLAETDILVQGTIDVSSSLAKSQRGAGASDATCPPITVENAMASPDDWASGGPGGSFGASGGSGGYGPSVVPVAAGATVSSFSRLRGGCRGSDGGNAMGSAGAGGDSGGAVALVANRSISVNGNIIAAGAAGTGANTGACGGGGGGGSGGAIVMQAPSITVSALLFTGGGGGGGAADGNGAGRDGMDPDPQAATTDTALGGTGASGGSGGDGGWSSMPAGTAGANGDSCSIGTGGGGGGGGLGIVEIDAVTKSVAGATIVAVQI